MDGGVKRKSIVSKWNISGVAVCVLLVGLVVETAAAEPNLVAHWTFDDDDTGHYDYYSKRNSKYDRKSWNKSPSVFKKMLKNKKIVNIYIV